jgi:hypothetical protein
MFSKRSGSKGKGKGKRHFRRRRSTRHRRRTHNRKGGGKTELKAELDALTEQWEKLTAHGAQVPYHVAQEFGQKRTELLTQLAALDDPKKVALSVKAFEDERLKDIAALKAFTTQSSAAIQKQEADVMSQWYQGHDGNWYPRK